MKKSILRTDRSEQFSRACSRMRNFPLILSVLSGPAQGGAYEIFVDRPCRVGRESDAQVSIPQDHRMSRRHFILLFDGLTCRIDDLGSANGTMVNGLAITSTSVRPGDRVAAGDTVFLVLDAYAAEPDVPATSDSGRSAEDGIMEVRNATPFQVATTLWHDIAGRAKLSVIVKATYAIEPGGSQPRLADAQLPVARADDHYDDDPLASVRLEADTAPFKPAGDIVIVGRAHAPRARPVERLNVGVRVGSKVSALAIFGDRYWMPPSLGVGTPTITSPEAFASMDLIYERAFGGIDSSSSTYCSHNLVGTGLVGKNIKEAFVGKRLPNLENPSDLILGWNSRPMPAGFGFFGRGWTPRLPFAGSYDQRRTPGPSGLPTDFSYRFFNGAHPDLQVPGYLRGDEEVDLINLSVHSRLHFKLPGVCPVVVVRLRSRSPFPESIAVESSADPYVSGTLVVTPLVHLDTLVFLPDELIFCEVFRAVCELPELNPEVIRRVEIL